MISVSRGLGDRAKGRCMPPAGGLVGTSPGRIIQQDRATADGAMGGVTFPPLRPARGHSRRPRPKKKLDEVIDLSDSW